MKTSEPLFLRRTAGCWTAVAMAAFGCGCATPALNKYTSGGKWEPGPPEQIWVFKTNSLAPELAVSFRQHYVGKINLAPRSALWCLSQAPESLLVGAGEIRPFTNSWLRPTTLPLYPSAAFVPSDPFARPHCYAVVGATNIQFMLYADQWSRGPYTLPTTIVKPRTALRVFGTPVALAADAAIVASLVVGAVSSGCGGIPTLDFH